MEQRDEVDTALLEASATPATMTGPGLRSQRCSACPSRPPNANTPPRSRRRHPLKSPVGSAALSLAVTGRRPHPGTAETRWGRQVSTASIPEIGTRRLAARLGPAPGRSSIALGDWMCRTRRSVTTVLQPGRSSRDAVAYRSGTYFPRRMRRRIRRAVDGSCGGRRAAAGGFAL